jgi:hypothetical protein
VRIPAGQELPQTAPGLLVGLEKAYLALAGRELVSAPTQSFGESLKHFPDQQKLARAFQEKNDVLKLKRIRDFYEQKQLGEARSRADLVIADPDSDIEVKFWAQIQLQAIDYRELVQLGSPQNELPKVALKCAKAIQRLTRPGPRHLKFYALISRHAAELEIMAHENFSLFMALKLHLEKGGNPMMVLGLYGRRSALTRQIVTKYNRCLRLARYAATYRDRWALGRALTTIVKAIASYVLALRLEGRTDAEAAFSRSAVQICKLAAWISADTGDGEGIVLAILSALSTVDSKDTDAFRWAEETARGLVEGTLRADALQVTDRATRRWAGVDVEGDYHGDTTWQAIQNVATGIGLDISDENSPLVRELRIAARDDSPERVLVKCEHLLAAQGAVGPTARNIRRLLSIDAGSKVVHCTLHDYHVEERDLDSAYSEFRRLHCDNCPDAAPRPSDWHYDEEARQLEIAKYGAFVARFLGRRFGLRYTDKD